MKKVTISAAVLALAMMGCSDAGLDNSVASTNEVKNESQNAALLAKSGDYYYPNIAQPYVEQMPLSESTVYNFQVGAIKMRMNSSYGTNMYGTNNGRMYAVGTCSVDKSMGGYAYRAPDYMRAITLPLYNCRLDQNPPHYTVHCDHNGFYDDNRNINFLEVKQERNVKTVTAVSRELSTNSHWSTEQNSITYCIAVWNKGQQNQTILSGTVFGGNQFKKDKFLAQRAYELIFVPAINDWCVKNYQRCLELDQ